MKKSIVLFILMLLSANLMAQNDLSGIVLDNNGQPVKGINVRVQYTHIFAKSNKAGEFKLKRLQPTDSVRVYKTPSIFAQFLPGSSKAVKLQLTDQGLTIDRGESQKELAEYQKETRDNGFNGNIITAKMIERNNYQTIVEAIKANVGGIDYGQTSSGGTSMTIRGQKSMNLSNEPMVLVDGVQTDINGAESMCNIHDIESIEVNKDGLGYGVRGANGVIII